MSAGSITIGELLMKVGLKGSNETKRGLSDVKGEMNGLFTSGLATKAMLVGVVWQLKNLMGGAIQTGQALGNFSDLTGISAKSLQQWQWAAQQVGISKDSVVGAFKSVQSSMTDMLISGNRPESWNFFQKMVNPDMKKLRDTEYMLKKLQEFSQKAPADLGRKFLGQFGLDENMIVAMRRNAFREDVFKNAPIQSDAALKNFNRIGVKWENMMTKFDQMWMKLTNKHGDKFITDISKVADQVVRLIENVVLLADKLKVFETFGTALEGWSQLLQMINQASDAGKTPEEMANPLKGKNADQWKKVLEENKHLPDGSFGGWLKDSMRSEANMKMIDGPLIKDQPVQIKSDVKVSFDGNGNPKATVKTHVNDKRQIVNTTTK